jgi:hypothetical protein
MAQLKPFQPIRWIVLSSPYSPRSSIVTVLRTVQYRTVQQYCIVAKSTMIMAVLSGEN